MVHPELCPTLTAALVKQNIHMMMTLPSTKQVYVYIISLSGFEGFNVL